MTQPYYCVIDTETTGLEPGSRMVELCCLLLDEKGETQHRFGSLVNPEMPIPPDVQELHHIDDDMVEMCPTAGEAAANLLAWLQLHTCNDVQLIMQNVPYDVGILSWAMERADIQLPTFQTIDTKPMAVANKAAANNKNAKLAHLVEHYGIIRIGEAHRAFSDADATRQLFNILRDKVPLNPTQWTTEYHYTAELPEWMRVLPARVGCGEEFSFDYVDKEGAATQRTIVPYGWAMTAKGLMFHGLCRLRGERRSFYAAQARKRDR